MMSIKAQRNTLAAALIIASLALIGVVLAPSQREAEATGTRSPTLAIQSHHYSVSETGVDLPSVVGTLTSDVSGDHKLEITIYVTPSGGTEQQRGKGIGWIPASGTGFVVTAQPRTQYASGDVVRAVFRVYDAQEVQVYTSQLSITIP